MTYLVGLQKFFWIMDFGIYIFHLAPSATAFHYSLIFVVFPIKLNWSYINWHLSDVLFRGNAEETQQRVGYFYLICNKKLN